MKLFAAFLKRYVAVFVFLAVWEISSRSGLVNSLFIPPFSKVLGSIWSLAADGTLYKHVLASMGRAGAGFLLALVVSIPLGVILAGWSQKIRIAVEPVVELFSHVNPFVLLHVIILFAGSGEGAKITIIAWTCIWPMVFSTLSGILHADTETVKAARSFGVSRCQLTVKVLLPGAAPFIWTGMRLAAGHSLMFLIAAEMMGATSGLGWLIYTSQYGFQILALFSSVTVIALLSILIDGVMSAIGKRLFLFHLPSR